MELLREPTFFQTSSYGMDDQPVNISQQGQNSSLGLRDILFTNSGYYAKIHNLILKALGKRSNVEIDIFSPETINITFPQQSAASVTDNAAAVSAFAITYISSQGIVGESVSKKYVSLSEALLAEEETYRNLEARKERSRQAEGDFWRFLNENHSEE